MKKSNIKLAITETHMFRIRNDHVNKIQTPGILQKFIKTRFI